MRRTSFPHKRVNIAPDNPSQSDWSQCKGPPAHPASVGPGPALAVRDLLPTMKVSISRSRRWIGRSCSEGLRYSTGYPQSVCLVSKDQGTSSLSRLTMTFSSAYTDFTTSSLKSAKTHGRFYCLRLRLHEKSAYWVTASLPSSSSLRRIAIFISL